MLETCLRHPISCFGVSGPQAAVTSAPFSGRDPTPPMRYISTSTWVGTARARAIGSANRDALMTMTSITARKRPSCPICLVPVAVGGGPVPELFQLKRARSALFSGAVQLIERGDLVGSSVSPFPALIPTASCSVRPSVHMGTLHRIIRDNQCCRPPSVRIA
jgi:hypothetical protein